jgi:hypothetical protein
MCAPRLLALRPCLAAGLPLVGDVAALRKRGSTGEGGAWVVGETRAKAADALTRQTFERVCLTRKLSLNVPRCLV